MILTIAYRTIQGGRIEMLATPSNIPAIISLLTNSENVVSFKVCGEHGAMTKKEAEYNGFDTTKLVEKLFNNDY